MKVKNYITTAVVTLSLAIGITAFAHGPGGPSGSGSAMDSDGYGMMGGSAMMGGNHMMGGNNIMGQYGSNMMPQNNYMPDMNHRNRSTDNILKHNQNMNPQDGHSDWLHESDLNQHHQNKYFENNPS